MKREEAAQKTISSLLRIARNHFTKYGYHDVSLEQIAQEAEVTRGAVYHHFKNKKGLFLAVLHNVQKDVAMQVETEALKSEDPWQQLLLGCLGFVEGANTKKCRRILLVDAPVVVGWDAWRKADHENSMNVLQKHIDDLDAQGYLEVDVDTNWMTSSISGALNELALQYPTQEAVEINNVLYKTVAQMVSGFRKK